MLIADVISKIIYYILSFLVCLRRSEDMGMAGALVGILANAQQEVPDFLQAFGSGGDAGGGVGGFGATDTRQGVSTAAADEEW